MKTFVLLTKKLSSDTCWLNSPFQQKKIPILIKMKNVSTIKLYIVVYDTIAVHYSSENEFCFNSTKKGLLLLTLRKQQVINISYN